MKTELSKVDLDVPMDGKMPRGEYIRLMGDLMVASIQSGLTNVATFMVGPRDGTLPIFLRVYLISQRVIIRRPIIRAVSR